MKIKKERERERETGKFGLSAWLDVDDDDDEYYHTEKSIYLFISEK